MEITQEATEQMANFNELTEEYRRHGKAMDVPELRLKNIELELEVRRWKTLALYQKVASEFKIHRSPGSGHPKTVLETLLTTKAGQPFALALDVLVGALVTGTGRPK